MMGGILAVLAVVALVMILPLRDSDSIAEPTQPAGRDQAAVAATVSTALSIGEVAAISSRLATPPESMYTSPVFGYSFGWDRPWATSWSTNGAGFDQMVITNGVGALAFTGSDDYGGDPERCLEGVADGMTTATGFAEVTRADAGEVSALIATSSDSQSARFVYTMESDASGEQRRVARAQCIVLVPNHATLAIVFSVPADEESGQEDAMRSVLTTLQILDQPTRQ